MFPADSLTTADDDQMARTPGAATTTNAHREPSRIPSPIDAAFPRATSEGEIEGGEAGGIRQAPNYGETIGAIFGAGIDGRAISPTGEGDRRGIGGAAIGGASPDR